MRSRPPSAFASALLMLSLSFPACAAASGPTPRPGPGDHAGGQPPSVPASIPVDNLAPGQAPFDAFGGLALDGTIPTPGSVIGHDVGRRFTRHHLVMAYMRALDDATDRARFARYGGTVQGRELGTLTISSPANMARLDEILERNRALADPATPDARADEIVRTNPAIVWFSFNVHGNEASCSEAALQVAYTLCAGTNPELERALERLVIVIDPMLNPDGRERYLSFLENAMGAAVDPSPDGVEHDEPWPGGRTNHWLFDLNRDWVWLTQPESRQRVAAYRRVMPQLHVDYHEQGYTSPYFLGAGDTPANKNLPDSTLEWAARYGDANADVFDREGLVFATKERFDFLYPGYGKTLPCYAGAIGLLCEQAGHSRAGLAIDLPSGGVLTLTERARHHFLTAMSYVESTSAWRSEQLERFRAFFVDSMTLREGADAAYVIHADNDPALLARLWDWASAHGVCIDRLTGDARLEGLHDQRDASLLTGNVVRSGSWVIRADQPMGRLVNAMFERAPEIEDPDTYDLTSWNLPIAYGLHASYAAEPVGAPLERVTSFEATGALLGADDDDAPPPTALVIAGGQHLLPLVAGELMRRGVEASVATEAFALAGDAFGVGSLIVHRADNPALDLAELGRALASEGARARLAPSSMTDDGPVLGANANARWARPRILVLTGEGTNSQSAGPVRWMLDELWRIPNTCANATALSGIDLSVYDVIVMPEGDADRVLAGAGQSRVADWLRGGGTLVALGRAGARANVLFAGAEEPSDAEPASPFRTRAERADGDIEDRVAGVMLVAEPDTTHPLASGVGEWLGVIKRGTRTLPLADGGVPLARFARASEDLVIGGSISTRSINAIETEAYVTLHRVGRGRVIAFSDDPAMRGFQHAPMRLLVNAILFGPSVGNP